MSQPEAPEEEQVSEKQAVTVTEVAESSTEVIVASAKPEQESAEPASDGENQEKPDQKPPKEQESPKQDDGERGSDVEPGEERRVVKELGREVHPLTRIGKKMQLAGEQVVSERLSQKTTGLQREIVDDLDKLIQELKKKKKQQQSSSSSSSKSRSQAKRDKVNQPKRAPQPKPRPGQRNEQKPSRDSEERLDKSEQVKVDMQELNELMKDAWGHLPEKDREQMRQAAVEGFLPKYEIMIEKYFRRLAEENDELP